MSGFSRGELVAKSGRGEYLRTSQDAGRICAFSLRKLKFTK